MSRVGESLIDKDSKKFALPVHALFLGNSSALESNFFNSLSISSIFFSSNISTENFPTLGPLNLNSNSSKSPNLWGFDLNAVYSPPENLPQYFPVARALYFHFQA